MEIPLPIVIMKEGKWFVAECPLFDIATQGKTEEEVKENMKDLISEYLKDPDTPKPRALISEVMSVSLANIPVEIPLEALNHGKTSSTSTT